METSVIKSSLNITHRNCMPGRPVSNKSYSVGSPEKAWDVITGFVTQKIETMEAWEDLLNDAIDAGLDEDTIAFDGAEPLSEVLSEGDNEECRIHVQAVLNKHNIVGWYLKNNEAGDEIHITDEQGLEVNVLTLVKPSILISDEYDKLFY